MRGLVAAVVLALALAGCGVPLRADQVVIYAQPDEGIHVVEPVAGPRGGETVIRIENYTPAERQFVLARTDAAVDALPADLAGARKPSDHEAVVAVTEEMEPVERDFAGVLPYDVPSVKTLHVHLRPGQRYLLFDRLNPAADGSWLELRAQPT